ncbi:hypothetical protein LEP1GSC051_1206 [Leptospira sp. P2653]|nr:hypothetical protein LEP1GSC051_1206 [Leptospira sp. P2653]EMN45937.1 hypothetical protein LEP1GSC086_2250 [Leptospira weilii str. LNT 1234]
MFVIFPCWILKRCDWINGIFLLFFQSLFIPFHSDFILFRKLELIHFNV